MASPNVPTPHKRFWRIYDGRLDHGRASRARSEGVEVKAAFVVNARDKAKYVAKAVQSAISQTYPCHILLSDQSSTDGTFEAMLAASEMPHGAKHTVEIVRCPVKGPYSMATHNRHIDWLLDQTDAEWFFQCSADDYSLPGRVLACMEAIEHNRCSVIATNMWFSEPGQVPGLMTPRSQVAEGYVNAGFGMQSLVYGSCIAGYKRSFMKKIGPAPKNVTMDVYCGYLGALDDGYYVVGNEPMHVHQTVADVNNMGFQGKMRGAEAAGNKEELARLNELNHFQLFELYFSCKVAQQRLYPLAHPQDQNVPVQMMIDQAVGWYNRRSELHAAGLVPGVL